MGNCTKCHRLRTPGVDADRCLACHEPLARQIDRGLGLHGSRSSGECATCHKEHLGLDFKLVRFDSVTFVHDSAGYVLRGRHAVVDCRDCHRSDRVVDPAVREFKGAAGALDQTYLGLDADCAACHSDDDPHVGQFGDRNCAVCHQEEDWKGASIFVHPGTSYSLEGRHADAECDGCHLSEMSAFHSYQEVF